jgi:hypothetical protein
MRLEPLRLATRCQFLNLLLRFDGHNRHQASRKTAYPRLFENTGPKGHHVDRPSPDSDLF